VVLINLSGEKNYVPAFYDKNFDSVPSEQAVVMVIPNLVNIATESMNSKVIDNIELIEEWLK
jgi:hypothetical protein